MNITGRTTVFTILSHPSSWVVAPMIYNQIFNVLDLDMVYIAHDVIPDAINATIRYFAGWENLGGFNVTIPHKETVAHLLDTRCPVTSRIGVVNTVVRLEDGTFCGYNTDGIGALHALGDVHGARCLVIGAGGAAKAIIDALIHGGADFIYLLNRSESRADKVIKLFKKEKTGEYADDVLDSVDIVVQATPITDTVPFGLDLGRIKKKARCLETAMRPTAFADKASSLGLEVIPGYAMLYNQTKRNFRLFTGMDVADDVIKTAFKQVGYVAK
ncbi:MAG: shikimate dehydrogenase [Thermodesulfobacteriota bacterium]|nr:shikimate dehydrogenase [Thermodesulfobacteriota bacterium]